MLHIFPENIAKSVAEGQILQVAVFAVFFGIALASLNAKRRAPLVSLFESLAEVMFKFTNVVMYFAPIGVGAAMAYTVGHMGLGVLVNLGKLLLTIYGALVAFGLLVLLPILLIQRGAPALRVPGRDVVRFLLIGVLGVAASNYLYYLAIQRTNVAVAIILQYTAPILVLLYTVARGLQKPTLQRVASVGLAVTGIALVIGIFSSGGLHLDVVGVMAALAAAFSFAFYNVGGHSILARYDRCPRLAGSRYQERLTTYSSF